MLDVLWWIVVGLVAGWLAKLVVPGREPKGFLATVAIGVVGGLLGGFIWRLFGAAYEGIGILSAFVGAVVLLILYHAVFNRGRV